MDIRRRMGTGIMVGLLAAAGASSASATTGSSELNLKGGEKLQANAFHCGVFWNHCSWSSSAKLLGNTPKRASWIRNNAEIRAHGPSASITLGKSTNVVIEFKSKTLVKTKEHEDLDLGLVGQGVAVQDDDVRVDEVQGVRVPPGVR